MIGTLRIGGGGLDTPRMTATAVGERLALIDRCLTEVLSRPCGGVFYMEIDRDNDGFVAVDNYRACVKAADPKLIEFVRVGVSAAGLGEPIGAAEYFQRQLGSGAQTVYATHNGSVPAADQPRILYDDSVPTYFPPKTVVTLAEVRELMTDFATTGEWSHAALWREHRSMVA